MECFTIILYARIEAPSEKCRSHLEASGSAGSEVNTSHTLNKCRISEEVPYFVDSVDTGCD